MKRRVGERWESKLTYLRADVGRSYIFIRFLNPKSVAAEFCTLPTYGLILATTLFALPVLGVNVHSSLLLLRTQGLDIGFIYHLSLFEQPYTPHAHSILRREISSSHIINNVPSSFLPLRNTIDTAPSHEVFTVALFYTFFYSSHHF